MALDGRRGTAAGWAVYTLVISVLMAGIAGYQLWRRATVASRTPSCAAVVTFEEESRSARKAYDRFSVRCTEGRRTDTWTGETHAIDRAAVTASSRAFELDRTMVPEAALDHAMRVTTSRILLAAAVAGALLSISVLLRSRHRPRAT